MQEEKNQWATASNNNMGAFSVQPKKIDTKIIP